VIVDSTVQEKAIAHPVDSRLLEIAGCKVVKAAKAVGIALKQTFAAEGKELRRKAGGDAHAKQFKRLKKVVKRQRTILSVVMREVQRKLDAQAQTVAAGVVPQGEPAGATALGALKTLLGRAERIRTQQRHGKNKPYEFGVKVSLAVTNKQGLMVGARTFPGNPFDGHTLAQQLEQTTNLLQDLGRKPKQAIEPMIGHTKSDHRMDRCWLKGAVGDALHAISCAAGHHIRWLMRAIVAQAAKAAKAVLLAISKPALYGLNSSIKALIALHGALSLSRVAVRASRGLPLSSPHAGCSVGLR
jgi:IS5 family transposase